MSLILDALNRSRQDADPVPGLATDHTTESMTIGKRQVLPWIALLVAIFLIIWLVWERNEPAATEGVNAPMAELSRNIGSAVTSVTTELKARAEVPPPDPTPLAAIPAPVPPPAAPPPVPGATVQNTAPAPAPEAPSATVTPPAVVENAAVAELYRERDKPAAAVQPKAPPREVRPARVVEEEPVDIESVLRLAQEELENASLSAHPAPFLESLSQQTKDEIPTIYYQRHDYLSQESRSTVVLNGKTLKVGGSPLAGMKVDEILSDSVVLSYRGTQFRLRALNSWINL